MVALLPKIELRFDDAIPPDFDRMHAIVEISTTDGRQLSRRIDKLSGWIGSPLSREQRLKKFHSCARRVLDDASANCVLEAVEKLETLGDITAVMDILRCDAVSNKPAIGTPP